MKFLFQSVSLKSYPSKAVSVTRCLHKTEGHSIWDTYFLIKSLIWPSGTVGNMAEILAMANCECSTASNSPASCWRTILINTKNLKRQFHKFYSKNLKSMKIFINTASNLITSNNVFRCFQTILTPKMTITQCKYFIPFLDPTVSKFVKGCHWLHHFQRTYSLISFYDFYVQQI